MAKQLQLRGGTTAQHSTFTGAVREVTVDTDKDVVVVHDGATVGGFPMAKKTDVDSAIGTAVLLTGNQTIDGTKTFSSTISGSITGNAGSATTATTAGSCTGNSATATTASSCSGNSATATSATSSTTATNLVGGSLGTIPYQSASGTTAQLAAGTSGYYLKSNGAAAPSWAAIAAGGAFLNSTTITASTTWTAPAGVTRVLVQICGGGAGGAFSGQPSVTPACGGGGSCGYQSYLATVSPGTGYTISIGGGGGQNANGGNTTAFGFTAYGASTGRYTVGGKNGTAGSNGGCADTINSYCGYGANGPYGGGTSMINWSSGSPGSATNVGAGGSGSLSIYNSTIFDYQTRSAGSGYRGQVIINY